MAEKEYKRRGSHEKPAPKPREDLDDYDDYDEDETGFTSASDHILNPPDEVKKSRKQIRAEKEAAAAAEKAAKLEEKRRIKEERRIRRRKTLKTIKIILIILIVLAIGVAAGLGYWGYTITHNGVVNQHVKAGDIDLSGMTEDQVTEAIAASGWDDAAATPLTVHLPENITMEISRTESGGMAVKDVLVYAAMAYGHDGNWYQNLGTYLKSFLHSYDVTTATQPEIADDYLTAQIAIAESQYQAATAAQDYVVDAKKGTLTMIKGCGEVSLDESGLKAAIIQALKNGDTELEYSQIVSTAQMPDFDAIYAELAKDPVNAYYDEETKTVTQSEEGFTFDVEQAKQLWNDAGLMETVTIPVQVLEPETTTDSLNALLFSSVLGEQTTYYESSSDARINNINLAAEKINGIILNPGETFSYNDTVGQRTEEAGFQEAAAYSDGEVVQQLGGGICQVSSTLYSAMMYANLKTVSRSPHYFPVDYLPLGQDATVSWGKPDFKFSNNRDYPIRIEAICDNDEKSLTVRIIGTDVDGSYVELRHDVYTIYDDEYTDVAIGYGVQEFRDVYDADGNYITTVSEYYDCYHFHDYDINWPAGVTKEATF